MQVIQLKLFTISIFYSMVILPAEPACAKSSPNHQKKIAEDQRLITLPMRYITEDIVFPPQEIFNQLEDIYVSLRSKAGKIAQKKMLKELHTNYRSTLEHRDALLKVQNLVKLLKHQKSCHALEVDLKKKTILFDQAIDNEFQFFEQAMKNPEHAHFVGALCMAQRDIFESQAFKLQDQVYTLQQKNVLLQAKLQEQEVFIQSLQQNQQAQQSPSERLPLVPGGPRI